jgi:hypothetical protein
MTALLAILAALWIVHDIATINDDFLTRPEEDEETYHGTLF